MRYKITLSYDGGPFSGWQVQPDATTVQGCLEKALSTLLSGEVSVTGAGRTDTSVNAVGYVAHFDTDKSPEPANFRYKLNAILPREIVVHDVRPVSGGPEDQEGFHARFSATRREYTYFIHRTKDPFVSGHSYLYTFPLDLKAMNEAASMLVGTHDFRCFQKLGSDVKTSVCTVSEAYWAPYTPTHAGLMHFPCEEGQYLYFRISADRFLRNMVRAVVGSLLEVGRGRRSTDSFAELILPCGRHERTPDGPGRSDAGESVPGHALFLSDIDYPNIL